MDIVSKNMIKLKPLLTESDVAVKKLRIFDMDDTLVTTGSRIIVNHKNGTKTSLTPGEYAVYDKKSGDVMDYSEFQTLKNPREIKAMTKVLRIFYHSNGDRKLTILTARGVVEPIKEYLNSIGITNIEIIALNDSNPMKKAEWIESQIKLGYNDIFFIDDSPKNVVAVNTLKLKYPDLKWVVRLAKYR